MFFFVCLWGCWIAKTDKRNDWYRCRVVTVGVVVWMGVDVVVVMKMMVVVVVVVIVNLDMLVFFHLRP